MDAPSEISAMDLLAPSRGPAWVLFVLLFALGALALNSQSFWIDEANTAEIARQPNPAAWWQAMQKDHGSSAQMPVYMFYVWAWEKVSGTGEFALRTSNLPWLALALAVLLRRSAFLPLTVAISPFFWFYLNELRPYAMQISVTLVMAAALWRLAELQRPEGSGRREERFWVAAFAVSFLLLAGCSMLGVLWCGAALGCAMAVLGCSPALRLLARHAVLCSLSCLVLAALAAYYLWSMKHGARAATGPTGVVNSAFAGYELLGLTGLGPGRLEIRDSGVRAFAPFTLPLALHAGAEAVVLLSGIWFAVRNLSRRAFLGIAASLFVIAGLLVAAGELDRFRVLGRHFAPLGACLMLVTACGLAAFWERGGWRRAVAIAFLCLSLASAASLGLAGRHAKDDYRDAIALARDALARGEKVWWCADGSAAFYYGIPAPAGVAKVGAGEASPNMPGQAWMVRNVALKPLQEQPAPDVVIFSKPDLYDMQGGMREYLARNHYRVVQALPAFTLWQREPDTR
jgi:hypothetical protein